MDADSALRSARVRTVAVRVAVRPVVAGKTGTVKVVARVENAAQDVADRVGHLPAAVVGEKSAAGIARFGLAARTGFYLLLVGLTVGLAVGGGGGKQANAHGALTAVAANPLGMAAIVATAFGFLVFGAVRIWGAIRDDEPSRWVRVSTFLQGAFYVVLTWVPLSFALGHRQTGSEQQQHKTAGELLRLPAGRYLVIALGLIVIGVSINQIRTALNGSYRDGMDVDGSPRWVRRLVDVSGTVGIAARAVVFLPLGVFFIIAAAEYDPSNADGLDKELATVAHHPWGPPVLGLVAAGLLVFAVYSGLEARYRTVTKGQ